MHTHQRVLNTGDVLHGCTVHYVTAELDAGQPLAQGLIQVNVHDDAKTLANRVHVLEHIIYPQVVEWICTQTIQHTEQGCYIGVNRCLNLFNSVRFKLNLIE